MFSFPRASLAAACALALAACGDREPLAVTDIAPRTPAITAALECRANLRAGTVRCGQAELPAGVRGYVVVGGQHQYVDVISSNLAFDSQGQKYTFDVSVKNLIKQPMGTTDGVAADSNGVRLVFDNGPTVIGEGQAYMQNADGTGMFTAAGQPYYRYAGSALGADGILSTGETSSTRNWELHADPGVTDVTFRLYVVAEVPHPAGYVDVYGGGYLLSGDSVVLGDTVRTFVGGVDSTATVTWTTSDPTVATVDAAGKVTGVGEGSVVITATSGARTGSATLNVCPNLAVGQVFTTTAAGGASMCLGGYGTKAEFTYIPINLSQASSLASFTVAATGIDAVTGPPTPFRLPDLSGLRVPDESVVGASDLPILEAGRADVARLLGNRDALIRRGRTGPAGRRSIITPNVVPAVGDSMDLNTTTSCSGTASVRRGVVRSVKQHVIIVADTANPAGGFTTAQYDSIALEFDTIAWPVDTANFGAPTDVDGNGHVVAFFTRAVNELSPPASSSVTLGFWAPKDMFSSAPTSCPNSNEGEMFYMLVPDPTGAVNSNVRTVSFVRGNTTGTLGHEFQHLINGFRRTYDESGQKPLEEGFLNEGLSHVAEELMFYRASGMSPRINVSTGTNATSGVQLNARRVNAYNAYMGQNITRLRSWLQRPDTAGALKQNQNSLAVRGAVWAYLRYASDRVNGNEQAFWYSLVNSGLTGTANIQAAIGGADPFTWERDFTAAMYADDNSFTVLPQYRQPSWNFRGFYTTVNGSYQLVPRYLSTPTGAVTLAYSAGGGTSYVRFAVPASTFATVTGTGPGGTIPTSPYALAVVRTK